MLSRRTAEAGAAYFAIVFAVGFALGTVRTLFLASRFGEQLAVVMELPIILGASWIACGWVLRRWHLAASVGPRLTMGLKGRYLNQELVDKGHAKPV